MRNFKKAVLAGAMLLSVGSMSLPAADVSAASKSCSTTVTSTQNTTCKKFTSGNFCFKTTDKNTCTVTGLSSAGKKVSSCTVPSTVKCNGKTYKVTKVAAGAFKNCNKLKSVKLPSCITSVGSNAFSGCSNLKTVTCAKQVKSLGTNCFGNATCKISK